MVFGIRDDSQQATLLLKREGTGLAFRELRLGSKNIFF
jgi:hypothetical protein